MTSAWQKFQDSFLWDDDLGLGLDTADVGWPDGYIARQGAACGQALEAIRRLEAGALANADERRRVGHYWLRAPDLAPDAETRASITDGLEAVRRLAADVHEGRRLAPHGVRFDRFLLIGIGGSALGPQLVDRALRRPDDPLMARFLDNTDPDGFDQVLGELAPALGSTLVIVVSKSGGTPETRNGMLETRSAYLAAGRRFASHAVAVTGPDSDLDGLARSEGWVARLPLPDWVGGRTSLMSVAGLLPAALAGRDLGALLEGARRMDVWTRGGEASANPALRLALAWLHLTGGHGTRDMVILPYKDRLETFSRYLQQLVMESLGKERDREGRLVRQGLAVYGNKGSTDQHAYVQQLRDGIDNFFVTFVEVLREREGVGPEVEPGVTSGDYLAGFLHGTRRALSDQGRSSLTVVLERLDETRLGALVALFERAVGLYAEMIGVNAYNQPGVEAGKRAAVGILDVQRRSVAWLQARPGAWAGVEEIAAGIGQPREAETVFRVLRRLAASPERGIRHQGGGSPGAARFAAGEGQT